MISIIVPVYRVEAYLRQCVDSLLAQTYPVLEIILVDDGSPDNCPSVCDDYAAKDSRIKVIHQENKGLVEARKSGVRAAGGDYIGFVDGDDWIAPLMYKKIADAIEQYAPDCVMTQFVYAYADRQEPSTYSLNKPYYTRNEIEQEIFPTMLFQKPYYSFGIYPNCWTKVFKKSILEKHLFDVDARIRMGEDIAFTYPCLMECQNIAFVDEPLYYYRINTASMTKSYDKTLSETFMLPYKTLEKKSGSLQVDLSAQLPYYLLYLVNFVIRNEANRDNRHTAAEKRAVLRCLFTMPEIQHSLKELETAILPFHTKILVKIFRVKSLLLLSLYQLILRRFL